MVEELLNVIIKLPEPFTAADVMVDPPPVPLTIFPPGVMPS
jgi:hypothetical protein